MIIVVPKSHVKPSGGNIFNRLFLQALKKKGLPIEALTVGPALRRMKKSGVGSWWVDSLCLDDIGKFISLQRGGRKVYALIHDLPSLEPSLSPAERRRVAAEEKKVLQDVSGFLVTSPSTRSLLKKRGFSSKPILVVPPAAAVFPDRRHASARGFVGLMVGHLIPRKGILEFLTCLSRRLKPSDLFTLRIAGRFDIDPSYAEKCLKLMTEHVCLKGKAMYVGPLAAAEMKRYYERSAVFITASKMETFGMAIQEARFFGLPILALDAAYARRRLRPEPSSLLFRSIPALAEACIKYIRNPLALEAFARQARESVPPRLYDWGDAAQLFLDQLPG
jgi:glycosyltransferase involved in cell wall biosynthesis